MKTTYETQQQHCGNLVRDDPKLLDDGGEISKILRKGLAVQFSVVKSPLYLTESLPGGQLPLVFWRWSIGLLS